MKRRVRPFSKRVLEHAGAHGVAVVEVQGQEAALVEEVGRRLERHAGGVEVLRQLALDEQRVAPHLQDGEHGVHVGADHVLERGDERLVGGQPLVPPAVERAELGGDVHLVDRGVEPHPRVALREGPGEVGEVAGELRILEVAQPVRHAEVAQVDDGHDAHAPHLGHHLVRPRPVVPARPAVRAVVRRTVAQEGEAKLAREPEVFPPVGVVPALLQLVAALLPGRRGHRRIAALDPGGEDEALGRWVRSHLPAADT